MHSSLSTTTGEPPSHRPLGLEDVIGAIPGIEIDQLLPLKSGDGKLRRSGLQLYLPPPMKCSAQLYMNWSSSFPKSTDLRRL